MAAEDLSPRVRSPQERDDVVAILVGAFHDDPTWSWAFPDPSLRAEQHRRLWGLFVDGAMRYPWVWLTPGNTATSVWIPRTEQTYRKSRKQHWSRPSLRC